MKKKIRDLTEEEREMICRKSDCNECPLSTQYYDDFGFLGIRCFKDELEKEVEIPKEEKE